MISNPSSQNEINQIPAIALHILPRAIPIATVIIGNQPFFQPVAILADTDFPIHPDMLVCNSSVTQVMGLGSPPKPASWRSI